MAFMPFVTAGDPDLAMTQALIRALGEQGVDLIEVGFPYSDPIADGPVIQASYTRALQQHVHVRDIIQSIHELDHDGLPPLVAMVSYAIVFRFGLERFLDEARQAGFAGLIIPDLPGDEAADVFAQVRARQLDLVQLVAPTTPRERVRSILEHCSGFVYCVAVAGTTGARDQVASTLLEQLKWLRGETELPLCVGFGISRPAHLDPLRGLADGAIVGSAIVRQLQDIADNAASREQTQQAIATLASAMVNAAHGRGA
jgi:tryptophan synthase alpha chain